MYRTASGAGMYATTPRRRSSSRKNSALAARRQSLALSSLKAIAEGGIEEKGEGEDMSNSFNPVCKLSFASVSSNIDFAPLIYDFSKLGAQDHVAIISKKLENFDHEETIAEINEYMNNLDMIGSADTELNYYRVIQGLAEAGLGFCLSTLLTRGEQLLGINGFDSERGFLELQGIVRILWSISPCISVLKRILDFRESIFTIFNEILGRCCKHLYRSNPAKSEEALKELIENERPLLKRIVSIQQSTLSLLQNCLLAAGNQEDIIVAWHAGLIDTIVKILWATSNRVTGEICLKILLFVAEFGNSATAQTARDCLVIRAAISFWNFVQREAQKKCSQPTHPVAEIITRIAQLLGRPESVHCSLICSLPRHKRITLKAGSGKMQYFCSYPDCGKSEASHIYKLKICSQCKLCRYCSVKCQQRHWKTGHAQYCNISLKLLSQDLQAATTENSREEESVVGVLPVIAESAVETPIN